jgi:hypothetical protein
VTDCDDEEGTEERGGESVAGCDMVTAFFGVVVGLLVGFCDV